MYLSTKHKVQFAFTQSNNHVYFNSLFACSLLVTKFRLWGRQLHLLEKNCTKTLTDLSSTTTMANTLRPYLDCIRHTLTAAMCLRNFPSQQGRCIFFCHSLVFVHLKVVFYFFAFPANKFFMFSFFMVLFTYMCAHCVVFFLLFFFFFALLSFFSLC